MAVVTPVGGVLPAPVVDCDAAVVYVGDAVVLLSLLGEGWADAVVTDPPYGLGFSGEPWDGRAGFARSLPGLDVAGLSDGDVFQAWCQAWAAGALACLRPGGHLVAFGGTRTWHRLAAGVEAAGFEVRDQIAWLYSSGVPKSLDLSNAADKRLGAVRPDREVVVSERDTVLGVTRRVVARGVPVTLEAGRLEGWGTGLKPAFEPILVARKPCEGGVVGNVLEHGVGGLNIGRSRTAGGRWPANAALDGVQAARLDALAGAGVSARFPVFHHASKASPSERPRAFGVSHATVKPLSLMRWLVGLVAPAGGVVLEPFAGSGATVEAAVLEGMRVVAVEKDPSFAPLVRARLDRIADADLKPTPG
ncbi:MAG: site-specific DNA-methyltransferase [Bifidobacteriaceae bacterium]|nr:site-specific DNA-methyltransferase [Bifidobacteriaceae bacterium]